MEQRSRPGSLWCDAPSKKNHTLARAPSPYRRDGQTGRPRTTKRRRVSRDRRGRAVGRRKSGRARTVTRQNADRRWFARRAGRGKKCVSTFGVRERDTYPHSTTQYHLVMYWHAHYGTRYGVCWCTATAGTSRQDVQRTVVHVRQQASCRCPCVLGSRPYSVGGAAIGEPDTAVCHSTSLGPRATR